MYYYNSSDGRVAANSFKPVVENYRYGEGESEDTKSSSSKNMLYYVLLGLAAAAVVAVVMNSRPKKNKLEMRFGHKFVL
jgi:hypothetical protein